MNHFEIKIKVIVIQEACIKYEETRITTKNIYSFKNFVFMPKIDLSYEVLELLHDRPKIYWIKSYKIQQC